MDTSQSDKPAQPDQPPTDPVQAWNDCPVIDDRRLQPCHGCGAPLGQKGATFWLVQPVRAMLDMAAVRETVALGLVFAGNTALGRVFGSRPLAREVDRLPEACLCEECACTDPVAMLLEPPAGEPSVSLKKDAIG